MNITLPFTNYSVHLVVCTSGGCTESADGVSVTTIEEGELCYYILINSCVMLITVIL